MEKVSPGPGQAMITDFSDSGSNLIEEGGAGTESGMNEFEIHADFRQPSLNSSHGMRARVIHISIMENGQHMSVRFFKLCVLSKQLQNAIFHPVMFAQKE